MEGDDIDDYRRQYHQREWHRNACQQQRSSDYLSAEDKLGHIAGREQRAEEASAAQRRAAQSYANSRSGYEDRISDLSEEIERLEADQDELREGLDDLLAIIFRCKTWLHENDMGLAPGLRADMENVLSRFNYNPTPSNQT